MHHGRHYSNAPEVLLLMTMMVMYSAMTGSAYTMVIMNQYASEIVRTSVRTVSSLRQFILDGLLGKHNESCIQRS